MCRRCCRRLLHLWRSPIEMSNDAQISSNDRLVIKRSVSGAVRLLGVTSGMLLAIATGALALTSEFDGFIEFGGLSVLAVGACLFGTGAAYAVYRLVSSKPALVIDGDGIIDTSSLGSAGQILWVDIHDIWIAFDGAVPVLTVDVYDSNRLIGRFRSPLKRFILRRRLQRGLGLVAIAEVFVATPLDLLLATLRDRWVPTRNVR